MAFLGVIQKRQNGKRTVGVRRREANKLGEYFNYSQNAVRSLPESSVVVR
jgi:hypothetical protein